MLHVTVKVFFLSFSDDQSRLQKKHHQFAKRFIRKVMKRVRGFCVLLNTLCSRKCSNELIEECQNESLNIIACRSFPPFSLRSCMHANVRLTHLNTQCVHFSVSCDTWRMPNRQCSKWPFFAIDNLTVYRIENQFKVLVNTDFFYAYSRGEHIANTPKYRVPLILFAHARLIFWEKFTTTQQQCWP